MGYTQRIRVRYGECDMQRVVFNPNYFVYCDDMMDCWTRLALADELAAAGTTTDLHAIGFDFMLKKAEMTWFSPARYGDTIATAGIDPRGGASGVRGRSLITASESRGRGSPPRPAVARRVRVRRRTR